LKDQHIGAAAGAIEALRLASLKAQLKQSFGEVHKEAGVAPEMIRGYGGKKVDRYDTAFTEEEFAKPAATLALVTDEVKAAMLRRTAQR